MNLTNLGKLEDIIQGVYICAWINTDTGEVTEVRLLPVTGEKIVIKDFNFFADEIANFRRKVQEITEGSK